MDFYTLASVAVVTADIPITRDNVKPGWIALWIVLALALATALLLRSMYKHTKKAEQPWESDLEAGVDQPPAG